MDAMFIGNSLVKKYDLHGFDTSKVKYMGCMFCNNSSLKEIDLSTFNTSSLESAPSLFYSSNNLEKVIMDNWNIRDNTVLGGAFVGTNIKTLSLKNWKIPENFTHLLGCRTTSLCTKNIETIDVTGWDLSKTKNVEGLFADSYVKEIIGLNTWDTSNITKMDDMFEADYNLTELDLSSFDTRNVTSTKWMFKDDSKLKTIKASDNFKLDHVTIENSDTMFKNCTSLVGGNGTLYNENHMDKEYARIDNPGIPGYFTKNRD
jgi:surface protein